VRAIAKKHKLTLVDHFRIWMEWDKKASILNTFLPDGVHPDIEGNRLIAQTTFEALKATFQNEQIIH
jgi:lysophospholipase L1-like esterase